MRFVFVIAELGYDGPSGSRIRFAQALGRRGHDVSILTFSARSKRDIPADVRVETVDAPVDGFPRGQRSRRALAISVRRWVGRELARAPIDFLSSSLTGTNRIVWLAGLENTHHWLHIPVSRLLEKGNNPWDRWRRRRRTRKVYHEERVIGVSQGVIDDLTRFGARPREAELVHNCFDLGRLRDLAREALPGIPEDPFVLHAGRFAGVKRHDLLFDAFRRTAVPHRLVLLVEDKPKLRHLIERHGLSGRVLVAGFQQNPYPFMMRAAALVLSSDQEGFPNVLVESLAVGTPVISTDCLAGPADILVGPYRRWLSPPGDAAALAANLSAVLSDPYAIEPWLVERFGMDVALDRLESIAARGLRPRLGRPRLFG